MSYDYKFKETKKTVEYGSLNKIIFHKNPPSSSKDRQKTAYVAKTMKLRYSFKTYLRGKNHL